MGPRWQEEARRKAAAEFFDLSPSGHARDRKIEARDIATCNVPSAFSNHPAGQGDLSPDHDFPPLRLIVFVCERAQ